MKHVIRLNHTSFFKCLMLFILISSLFSFGTILYSASHRYIFLCLQPLAFGLFSLVFSKSYTLVGKSITVTLLFGMMFIRNVIVPVLMSLGSDVTLTLIDTTDKMPYAVLLIVYEQLAIFGTIYYFTPKIKGRILNRAIDDYEISKLHYKWFKIIASLLALIVVVLLIRYPLLSMSYHVGISNDATTIIKRVQGYKLMDETVPKIPRYLFQISAELLRWMLPIIIILKLYLSRLKNCLKIFLSIVFAFCVVIFINDVIATSFFIIIAVFFFLYRLYEGQGSNYVVAISIAFVGIAISALFMKALGVKEGLIGLGDIASVLQAYFAGPDNVAVAAMIENPITISQIIGDTLGFIPYIMYFFQDLPNSRVLFNSVFWGTSGIQDQIIPVISQGARYFTPILAPIFSIFIVRCALEFEKQALEKYELLNYFIIIDACVCLAMGVVMYSASLVLQSFFNFIFPLMFIYRTVECLFRVKPSCRIKI